MRGDVFTGLSLTLFLFSRASLEKPAVLATEGMKAHLDLKSVPWNTHTHMHTLKLQSLTGLMRSKCFAHATHHMSDGSCLTVPLILQGPKGPRGVKGSVGDRGTMGSTVSVGGRCSPIPTPGYLCVCVCVS